MHREIQALFGKSGGEMNDSLANHSVVDNTNIPEHLTPVKVLKITVRIMKTSILAIREEFEILKAQGIAIDMTNPTVVLSLKGINYEKLR